MSLTPSESEAQQSTESLEKVTAEELMDTPGEDRPTTPPASSPRRFSRRIRRADRSPRSIEPQWRIGAALAWFVIPILAFGLCGFAAYAKWSTSTATATHLSSIESVGVARDAVKAMLTYQPDTVDQTLGAAQDLLTGSLRDDYRKMITDVVIPGARDKKVTTLVDVRAAACISAEPTRAVVLVFLNQNVIVGTGAPTDSASTVRVTLDKSGDRWLVSAFDPI